ncbi:CCR4-NOT transcription complex subunit 1 [Cichlidogyrus casuarinus]|uniref:CCR4-NOT transcription complex subunit 1 n=1 Tax=Cichlidogyrus casuarinus TaxID=1844966 RepID=A0ABD2QFW6_9PLAT
MELSPMKVPDPPDDTISDRVFFIFNNVSLSNVTEKSDELADLLNESILPWFSHYFIGKRVTQEQKFHSLFASVIDNMQEKLPKTQELIKCELLRCIKQILHNVRSDTDDAISRSNLRSLGNYLGLTTIAKNVPLLHDDLCLKDLVYEAYQKGPTPIRYVIPFVSSVLAHAASSIIELLFQKLNLKLENLHMVTYLRDASHFKQLDAHLIMLVNERPDSLPVVEPQPAVLVEQPEATTAAAGQGEYAAWSTHDQMMRQRHPKPVSSEVTTPNLPCYADVDLKSMLISCCTLDEQHSHLSNDQRMVNFTNLMEKKPELRAAVHNAIEAATKEVCTSLYERCLKITGQTVLAVVRKDFALDPDLLRIRREVLVERLTRHIGTNLLTAFTGNPISRTSEMEREMVNSITQALVMRSSGPCLTYTQKTVAETVMLELDAQLDGDLKQRFELGSQRFVEQGSQVIALQQAALPPKLRLQSGKPKDLDMLVYDEFRQSIPGFTPGSIPQPNLSHQAKNNYQAQPNDSIAPSKELATNIVSAVVKSIFTHLRPAQRASTSGDRTAGPDIMQHFMEAVMTTLRQLQSQFTYFWITRQVTQAWIGLPDEPEVGDTQQQHSIKWNWQAFIELLRVHIVSLPEIDTYLATPVVISGNPAVNSSNLAYKRQFTVLNEYDIWGTLEAMRFRVAEADSDVSVSASLRLRISCARVRALLDLGLIEPSLQSSGGQSLTSLGVAALYAGCSQAREFDDSRHVLETSDVFTSMQRWMEAYQASPHRNNVQAEQLLAYFVEGLLQGQVHVNAYAELDAYARLMACLIKRCGVKPSTAEQEVQMKIQMLNKILGLIAGMLLQENEVRREMFHCMPFQRIINMLFLELISSSTNPAPDTKKGVQEASSTLQNYLPIAFSHLLHILRPERATMFVFSWLELLAHRHFISRTAANNQTMYAQLLVDLLKYLAFFLQNALLPKPIQHLYRATLRLFIVLLHDFPEFVCNYYSLFCDALPSNTVQMRNLILSALPQRNISPPNPLHQPPMELLATLEDPTGYCLTAGQCLPAHLKCEIDQYLQTREPTPMLAELNRRLLLVDDQELFSKQEEEALEDVGALWSVRSVRQFATFGQADCMHYNVDLMTNLVIYLCLTAVKNLRAQSMPLNMETIASQPQMDIIHGLVLSLDNEGRFLLLNCMANQLRYPSSHTFYFSFALLHLFSHQTATESVKEQISRVLMERLIVAKPHPWGLLRTASELLRNPSYGFWEHDFARSNHNISSILTQVAERCIPNYEAMKSMRSPLPGRQVATLGSTNSMLSSC